jgi:hypothetical protein
LSNQNTMINYTSWPIILPNMKSIRLTTSEELRSQCVTISLKTLKSHNTYKNCRFKMAIHYDQLHIMTNYPTKYESCRINKFREIVFTFSSTLYIEILWELYSSITPTKIIESTWRDSMINYTSWLIILPSMKAIGPTTSESCIHKV